MHTFLYSNYAKYNTYQDVCGYLCARPNQKGFSIRNIADSLIVRRKAYPSNYAWKEKYSLNHLKVYFYESNPTLFLYFQPLYKSVSDAQRTPLGLDRTTMADTGQRTPEPQQIENQELLNKPYYILINDHESDQWARHIYPDVHSPVSPGKMLSILMPADQHSRLDAVIQNMLTLWSKNKSYCEYLNKLSILVKEQLSMCTFSSMVCRGILVAYSLLQRKTKNTHWNSDPGQMKNV